MNVDKDIFFVDKLARLWLVFVKVHENDRFLALKEQLDDSFFKLKLEFPALLDPSQKKRQTKAVSKQAKAVDAALVKHKKESPD